MTDSWKSCGGSLTGAQRASGPRTTTCTRSVPLHSSPAASRPSPATERPGPPRSPTPARTTSNTGATRQATNRPSQYPLPGAHSARHHRSSIWAMARRTRSPRRRPSSSGSRTRATHRHRPRGVGPGPLSTSAARLQGPPSRAQWTGTALHRTQLRHIVIMLARAPLQTVRTGAASGRRREPSRQPRSAPQRAGDHDGPDPGSEGVRPRAIEVVLGLAEELRAPSWARSEHQTQDPEAVSSRSTPSAKP